MNDTYKTVRTLSEGIYKDKGSKFLSFLIPVDDVDEIKDIVKDYRKKFYDARHVCYAYMLGHKNEEYRTNDDGEPSGTAGKPILGQIYSNELTNVLIIVVRYFGGILLGTSGLINAYKEAALDAVKNADIIDKTVQNQISISFGFEKMNEVMKYVKEYKIEIISQNFNNICKMDLSIRLKDYELFIKKLNKSEGISIEI